MGAWLVGIGVTVLLGGIPLALGAPASSTVGCLLIAIGGVTTIAGVGVHRLEQRAVWNGELLHFRKAASVFMRCLDQAAMELGLEWRKGLKWTAVPDVDLFSPPMCWRQGLAALTKNQEAILTLMDGVYGDGPYVGINSVLSQEDYQRFTESRMDLKHFYEIWGQRKTRLNKLLGTGFEQFLIARGKPLHADIATSLAFAEIVLAERLGSTIDDHAGLWRVSKDIGLMRLESDSEGLLPPKS